MAYATVNGVRYERARLDPCHVEPGMLVCGKEFRRAARIVAFDGDDAILRNMRHPDLVEAVSVSQMSMLYDQLHRSRRYRLAARLANGCNMASLPVGLSSVWCFAVHRGAAMMSAATKTADLGRVQGRCDCASLQHLQATAMRTASN